jgi:hypothetical protein
MLEMWENVSREVLCIILSNKIYLYSMLIFHPITLYLIYIIFFVHILVCIYRILVGKSEVKRPLGSPRRRWRDNIKMDLKETGWVGMDWIDLS